MAIHFTQMPFDEAISFFRQKINLPTETWTDIWQEMHDRSFVVAGAMQEDLLDDFRAAIDIALENGETIIDFRKRFDAIVKKFGWSYKGERGWRTGVIFHTNMRTAYAAGQYRQMQSTKEERPYARYIGGLSENPRPLHLKWDGLVLPIDDPWWDTHRPPNGWGCKCQVVSHSQTELDRDGRTVAAEGPDEGSRKWTDPNTGQVRNVPNGIDPGWAYDVGKLAWAGS